MSRLTHVTGSTEADDPEPAIDPHAVLVFWGYGAEVALTGDPSSGAHKGVWGAFSDDPFSARIIDTGGMTMLVLNVCSLLPTPMQIEERARFSFELSESALQSYIAQQGLNLNELLDSAGRHFESDVIVRRESPLSPEELRRLVRDESED